MKKKYLWKLGLIFLFGILYLLMLWYIYEKQSDYKVKLSTAQDEYHFQAGGQEAYAVEVKINNASNRILGSSPEYNVFLSYHIYDENGNAIFFDNQRSALEKNIFAHSRGVSTLYMVPMEKGTYFVDIDMVEEYVSWFSVQDGEMCRIKVVVE